MRRGDLAFIVAVALFSLLCASIGLFHPDRSFVVYRFAENLANGHGPVYNAGDAPVEGYGNTLWMFVCAALAKAGAALPATAWKLSLLSALATLSVLWIALRGRVGTLAAAGATGFAAASGPLAIAAMSGEGAALTALVALCVVVQLDRANKNGFAWALAGLTGVLLAMCGNALAVVFPAALLVRVRVRRADVVPRSRWMLALAVFAAGTIAFHAWRASTFGSIVPHARGFVARGPSLWGLFVVQPRDVVPFGWFYLMLFVAAFVGARGAGDRACSRLALGTALTCGLATLTAGDPLPGLAGSAALVPLLAIPIAALVDRAPLAGGSRAPAAIVAAAMMVAPFGWGMDLRAFAGHIRETHDATLQPLGEWMARWRPDGTLLCDAPGAVAYYSGWRTTPVTRTAPLSPAPDVVMLTSQGLFIPDMGTDETRIANELSGRYRVLGALRREWVRDIALILYVRNDIPVLTDAQKKTFPEGVGTVRRLNG